MIFTAFGDHFDIVFSNFLALTIPIRWMSVRLLGTTLDAMFNA
jgi:hypothetical protein